MQKALEAILFQARAQMPGGQTLILTSDETWRGTRTDYLTRGGAAFEGSEEPVGWQAPGFDDSAWSACTTAPGVGKALVASELPPCMETAGPAKATWSPLPSRPLRWPSTAVRFDFQDGKDGFKVYRKIQIIGKESASK